MSQKFLFDIGHPAHVHLFKNLIFHFQKTGIPFKVVTRDKEITNELLTHYEIPFESISAPRSTKLGMFREFLERTWKIYRLHKKEKFTHALGTSVSIGPLSQLTFGKVKSYNFNEDDDDVVPLYTKLAYPGSTKIINPDCLKYSKWKNKRVLVPSFHELAYLHPKNFTPDPEIPIKYGLEPQKYVILRLSALKAHHDSEAEGLSDELITLIRDELNEFEIIESNEGKKGGKIKPWDMHHVMAFAKMVISDSQTMSAESAILGVPYIRINNFVGRISYLNELENKYLLGSGFLPKDQYKIINCISNLKKNRRDPEKFKALLQDKIDFNQWQISFLKN